jgi:hypothetical protein
VWSRSEDEGERAASPELPSLRLVRWQVPAYVSIRQHTSAYVSIRQHTPLAVIEASKVAGMLTYADLDSADVC